MTTLAANARRDFRLGDEAVLPAVASDIVFEGSAVGSSSGYARPLVAGDVFLGFCEEKADNSSGSAGDVDVRIRKRGEVELPVGSLAITDVGAAVYASDDNAFTLTAGSNSYIGRVIEFKSSGVGIVAFDAGKAGNGALAALTDSTGGTANDTVAAVADIALSTTDTYTDAAVNTAVNAAIATINDDLADVVAKVNALIKNQK